MAHHKTLDEKQHTAIIIKSIQEKIMTLGLQDYMVAEIHYILSHLNLYKLQNLKHNMRSVIAMLKKINKQHGTFIKQINANVNHYLAHEHHTFTNKMKTLINLNVSELAHIAIEKHASPKSKTMHNSLKKYYNSIKLVQDMEQKDEL